MPWGWSLPIKIEWADQDKTIIYARTEGRTEHEEFVAAVQAGRGLLASVSHPVDVIYDHRKQFFFTPGLLKTAQEVHSYRFQNLRFVVFVGRNLAWEIPQVFAHRFGNMPYRFTVVDTPEEAYKVIHRIRLEASLKPPSTSARLN